MNVETAIDLNDRARQVAINFAGRMISSSDGTYDLLITVVQDAMMESVKAAIEEEREACASVADAWVWPDLEGKPDSALASRIAGKIARKIRARSDVKP